MSTPPKTAVQGSGMKEVVPQSEVGLNRFVSLAQGHTGRYV
jgi:hypothetical protein